MNWDKFYGMVGTPETKFCGVTVLSGLHFDNHTARDPQDIVQNLFRNFLRCRFQKNIQNFHYRDNTNRADTFDQ